MDGQTNLIGGPASAVACFPPTADEMKKGAVVLSATTAPREGGSFQESYDISHMKFILPKCVQNIFTGKSPDP